MPSRRIVNIPNTKRRKQIRPHFFQDAPPNYTRVITLYIISVPDALKALSILCRRMPEEVASLTISFTE